jgi:ATP-dependent DNA helicase RecQ
VLNLQDADLQEIIVTLDSLAEEAQSLKTVHQTLDERYDYGVIRCVMASVGMS